MLRILFLACFACLSLATEHDYLAKVEEWLKKNPEFAKTTNISEAQFADFLEHTLAGWRFPWIGQNDTAASTKHLEALDWPLIESHDPIDFEKLFSGDTPKFFIPKTALTEPVVKFLKLVNGTLLPHKKSELFGVSCKYHVLGFVCEIAIFPLPWPLSFLNFLGYIPDLLLEILWYPLGLLGSLFSHVPFPNFHFPHIPFPHFKWPFC